MADHFKEKPKGELGFEDRARITAQAEIDKYARTHVVDDSVRKAVDLALTRLINNPYSTIGDVRKEVSEILAKKKEVATLDIPVPRRAEEKKFSEADIIIQATRFMRNYGLELTDAQFNKVVDYAAEKMKGKPKSDIDGLNKSIEERLASLGFSVGAPSKAGTRLARIERESPEEMREKSALIAQILEGKEGGVQRLGETTIVGKVAKAGASAEKRERAHAERVAKRAEAKAEEARERAEARESFKAKREAEAAARAEAEAKKKEGRLARLEGRREAAAKAAEEKAERAAEAKARKAEIAEEKEKGRLAKIAEAKERAAEREEAEEKARQAKEAERLAKAAPKAEEKPVAPAQKMDARTQALMAMMGETGMRGVALPSRGPKTEEKKETGTAEITVNELEKRVRDKVVDFVQQGSALYRLERFLGAYENAIGNYKKGKDEKLKENDPRMAEWAREASLAREKIRELLPELRNFKKMCEALEENAPDSITLKNAGKTLDRVNGLISRWEGA